MPPRPPAPADGFVHAAFGRHLPIRGEFEAAQAALLTARRLDPHDVTTRMHLVNLRIGQRRLDEARAELEGLLVLEQGDAEAAVGHYRQACEAAPGHGHALASPAAALYAAGRAAAMRARRCAGSNAASTSATPTQCGWRTTRASRPCTASRAGRCCASARGAAPERVSGRHRLSVARLATPAAPGRPAPAARSPARAPAVRRGRRAAAR